MKPVTKKLVLAMAIILIAGAAWVGYVRMTTGEWSLLGSEAPPRISQGGRHYNLDPVSAKSIQVPSNAVPDGSTLGGGQIFKTAGQGVPVSLWVKESGGQVRQYSLSGSP